MLVRENSATKAQQRIENLLKILSPEIDIVQARRQIRVICGDITLSGLGLSEPVLNSLATEVTHIIHAAASTQFQLPLKYARLVNYKGTKNIMAFAKQAQDAGNLQHVGYISTAYVCGKKEGTIYEDDMEHQKGFSNTYEQTKWESEQFVRNLMSDLPVTIFRPSIVVGDSKTGMTLAFNVLYTPLKWIQKGVITVLPCSPDTPLDVVPVDFVSNAILHFLLKTEKCIGKIYHLVAGKANSATVGEIVKHAINYFNNTALGKPKIGIKFSPPYFYCGPPPILHGKVKRALQLIKIYESYICTKRHFDNTNTINALQGTNISTPKLSSYFNNILSYCYWTNWGKRIKYAM